MRFPCVTLLFLTSVVSLASAGELAVVGHVPAPNAGNVAAETDITIDFDRAVSAASLPPGGGPTIQVYGMNGGPTAGTFSLENGATRVRFDPDAPFFAGETVRVVLGNSLQAVDASLLRSAGYAFEFTVRTGAATRTFSPLATIDMRDVPQTSVRIYGGQACDLNDDGNLDIATINEDAADIRVLLNQGDCSGAYASFLTPTSSVGPVPSPNFPSDFDRDGTIDIATCNTSGGSISIVPGNGDGTFSARQDYAMGSGPHGLAILDVNGDGAMDVATANTSSNNVALRINDGSGGFGSATTFDGGGNGEYGLSTADFDNDGIFDLVVGCRSSQDVTLHLGHGDGTFAAQTPVAAGGLVWMIVCGDVNGDGNTDVTTANSQTGNGSILLGDGAGGLGTATTYAVGGHLVATDLGDLDGDGDLDWVLSNFGSGSWSLLRNDGSGTFTLDQTFPAPSNAACALLFDFDNDQDLDMALLDEIADVVVLMENDAAAGELFCSGDGTGTTCPCGSSGLPCRGCDNSAGTGGVQLTARAFAPDGSGGGTVSFDAAGFPPSGMPTVLAIRSTTRENGGAGSVFGDGLLCVAAPLVRLTSTTAAGGDATLAINHGAGSGTFHYALWYRNSAAFCTADTFNLSNGLTLTWP